MSALRRAAPLPLLLVALLACPSASSSGPPRPPRPRVVLETPSGARHAVQVELARTPEAQARGLMFRRVLGDDEGMLFVFPATDRRAFWMKNTFLALDMIFVDEGGVVVGIVAEAEPLTETPRDPGVPCRYVLEVVGGWAARHGVAPGARLRIEEPPPGR